MAFDFAEAPAPIAAPVAGEQLSLFDLMDAPARGWAGANPDRAMAYLFVAQADNGEIAEILAA